MNRRKLGTPLLAGALAVYMSCALSQDRVVAPPPFIEVVIRNVALQGACLATQEKYRIYTRPLGAGHTAQLNWAVSGAQVYGDVPVSTQGCTDASFSWPDVAAGDVQSAVSPTTGQRFARLVIGARSSSQCSLNLDLPLRQPSGGGTCAPLNAGVWPYCGCPEIYQGFKAR